jgi:DNA helicase HerA-like ATPase
VTFVLGRDDGDGPVADVGVYRALDGSRGAPVALDLDRPHAVAVVGKRGYGKSHTLGVLLEELAAAPGLAPVVVDPMGTFAQLAEADGITATATATPTVDPAALDPASWCPLIGLSAESGPGGLVWDAARAADTLSGMDDHVAVADAPQADVRAARNHLAMADAWNVFDPGGVDATALSGGDATVLDCSGLDAGPMNAVARVVAETLYTARVGRRVDRLPWLLVDEAHAFFEGIAGDAFETLLTRGRAPGVSLVVATQRPGVLPPVCLSQTDVLFAHRLTAERDIEALESARPTYVDRTFASQLPEEVGEAVVVDDATETVHALRVRERRTPHGGASPRASEVAGGQQSPVGEEAERNGRVSTSR